MGSAVFCGMVGNLLAEATKGWGPFCAKLAELDPAVAMPVFGATALLVTSRRRMLPGGLSQDIVIDMGVLEPADAGALLREGRADLAGPEHDAAINAVAGLLGRHALACAFANAYLAQRPVCSPEELAKRLAEQGLADISLLDKAGDAEAVTAGYAFRVREALLLHKELLDDDALAVLRVGAFCAPDEPIPAGLLRDACGLDDERVEDALARLHELSIGEVSAEGLSLHVLTQEAVREDNGAETTREPVVDLVRELKRRFTNDRLDDPDAWIVLDPLCVHARAIAAWVATRENASSASFLLNQIGMFCHSQARFEAALSCLEESERIDRAAYGDDHPNVARDVNNIGSVLHDQGDLAGAAARYVEAFGIVLDRLGTRAEYVAVVAGNLIRVGADPFERAAARHGEAVAAALREAYELRTDQCRAMSRAGLAHLADRGGGRARFVRTR